MKKSVLYTCSILLILNFRLNASSLKQQIRMQIESTHQAYAIFFSSEYYKQHKDWFSLEDDKNYILELNDRLKKLFMMLESSQFLHSIKTNQEQIEEYMNELCRLQRLYERGSQE